MVELIGSAAIICKNCGKEYTIKQDDFWKVWIEHEYEIGQEPPPPVGTSYVWSWRKACPCGSMIEYQADAWEHPFGKVSSTHQYIGMEETGFNGDTAIIMRKFELSALPGIAQYEHRSSSSESETEQEKWSDFYFNYRGT